MALPYYILYFSTAGWVSVDNQSLLQGSTRQDVLSEAQLDHFDIALYYTCLLLATCVHVVEIYTLIL